jgi:ABC-type glycerol-3-phosphate transport system substrate-binding protein
MYQHYYKYLCSTTQSFLTDGQPDFDNQASRDILSFFYKMDGEGKGTIWDSGLTEKSNFTSGECAIIDQSLYFTDYIERYNPTMNYKFMPQPKYSVNGVVQEGATNGGMLGGFGLAFPLPAKKYRTESYTAKVNLAWQFTKDWLLNEDLQKKWSQEIGTLPSLKSLYTTSTVLDNETLRNAAQYVDLYKNRPQIVGYLTMQTQVIDTCIKAYTEGKATLESTINSLTVGCRDYM